jgi:hypothetical protein
VDVDRDVQSLICTKTSWSYAGTVSFALWTTSPPTMPSVYWVSKSVTCDDEPGRQALCITDPRTGAVEMTIRFRENIPQRKGITDCHQVVPTQLSTVKLPNG